jgi:hypothetical protein
MARPSKKTVAQGLESWDGDVNDNFSAILTTPFPPGEYANIGVLPAAALYNGCIAWVSGSNLPFISRNGAWIPLAPITKYSTSEQDSGLRWTDGSVIYQKTVSLGALPDTTTKNVAHSISGLGTVIKIEGMVDNGTDQYPLPAVATNGVEIKVDDTNIVIVTTSDWSGFTGYLTVFYLK